MIWLIAQMALWLLIAAGFGGLIGWALHAMRGAGVAAPSFMPSAGNEAGHARIAELEAQLGQEREELESVRGKLTDIGVATSTDPEKEGSLAWRNRYLESRVRFLEGKLADVEAAAAPAKPPEEVNDDATRLRWRNRYLEGRVKYLEEELVRGENFVAPPAPVAPISSGDVATLERPVASVGVKPATLDGPRNGQGDDLKEIAGIGPKLEQVLHGLGVWHFDQIASWTPAEIDWVNAAISFRGRIEREKWVAQANQLQKRNPS